MLVGVKFCGGCNPRYDRGKLLKRLKEDLKGQFTFESANESQFYEGLIVFCGCTNACASYKNIKTKRKPILVWGENQYNDIMDIIKKKWRDEN